jgi:hypothetical protein
MNTRLEVNYMELTLNRRVVISVLIAPIVVDMERLS